MGSIILGAPAPPPARARQRAVLKISDDEMASRMNIPWRDLIAGEERCEGYATEDRAWADAWDAALQEILETRKKDEETS